MAPQPTPADVSVAFICAMPMELRPLASRLPMTETQYGVASGDDAFTARTGTCHGRSALAMATGIGTELAAARTQRMLSKVHVGHVIVFGIAGAVDDATAIGTLIWPRAVVGAATGTTHVPVALGPAAPHGILWTTDDFITDPGEVAGLRSRGVVALDMETAAIAAVCEQHGVGWSVVRSISDRATDNVVTEEVFRLSKPDGTADGAAVRRYFARHPGHVPRMARLALAARKATRAAARAAIAAGSLVP